MWDEMINYSDNSSEKVINNIKDTFDLEFEAEQRDGTWYKYIITIFEPIIKNTLNTIKLDYSESNIQVEFVNNVKISNKPVLIRNILAFNQTWEQTLKRK